MVLAVALMVAACGEDQGAQSGPVESEAALVQVSNEQTDEGTFRAEHAIPGIQDGTWTLLTMNGTEPLEGGAITLILGSDGRIYGISGCNNYSGEYTLEDELLGIAGNMVSTRRACLDAGMMEQEQEFLNLLPAMRRAQIDGNGWLILSGENGETLIFSQE